jgi:hypothetical protein
MRHADAEFAVVLSRPAADLPVAHLEYCGGFDEILK